MDERRIGRAAGAHWAIDEIPFHDIDRDLVSHDQTLFYGVVAASFIEITADLYTAGLVEFYRGDDEATEWLSQQWEPEELQHGAVLKRYVESAWPEFNWKAAYHGFFSEYSRCCGVDVHATTRELEFAARCVVETGTATFYRALSDMTGEPVLKGIANLIAADEVRHYKHFYRFYRRYHERERTSRLVVARALWRRMTEVDAEDGLIAFKHVFLAANPGCEFQPGDYRAFRARARLLARHHYPVSMAVRMLLKPLELSSPVVRVIVPPLVSTTQFFLRL
jgi:hypothetical protein